MFMFTQNTSYITPCNIVVIPTVRKRYFRATELNFKIGVLFHSIGSGNGRVSGINFQCDSLGERVEQVPKSL